MGIARLVLLGLLALGCGPGAADEAAPLLPLHEVGPWPWTSSLVAYRDRLWLANSDRTRDCSCADLYSFDPAAGAIVYERHLFSQSVGRPVVHGGLLYWPYEDSRWNLGVAHMGVTDGERWRLLAIEDAQPLTHATAMASDGTTLWLATANPGLRLFASRDGGLSWTARAGTPPREGLRWVLRAAPFAGGLYGIVIDGLRGRSRWLARIDTGRPERVADLPAGADALEVIVHDGRLLALAEVAGSGELWASDGERSEPLGPGPPRGRLRDVASDAEGRLWALSLAPPGGLVWRRGDTGEWLLEARVEGGLPQELELVAGRPFVGGHADGGTGALWGAIGPGGEEPAPRAALPEPGGRGGNDWRALEARARAALAEPGAYQESARDARAALHALARSAAPPAAFERLLEGPFPDATAPFLQGGIPVPTRMLGAWLALWSTTIAGRGRVPVALLAEPWPAQPLGRAEKHFEPLLAALEAIAWTGQSDADTIDALVARLDAPGDPRWLRGDVVGTLSAVTGEGHGYDAGAWSRWWSAARAEWPAPAAATPARAK